LLTFSGDTRTALFLCTLCPATENILSCTTVEVGANSVQEMTRYENFISRL